MNKSSFFPKQILIGSLLAMISVLVLTACHPIQHPEYANPVRASTVHLIHYAFEPSKIVVSRGQKVTWINNDSAAHTVTSNDKIFDSGKMSSGQTFSYIFTRPGTYYYYCAYHPNMKGIVEVR